MERGLFRKFFAVFLSILLICVTFLGLLLLMFTDRYMAAQTKKQLELQMGAAQTMVGNCFDAVSYRSLPQEKLIAGMNFLNRATGNGIFLVNTGGSLIASSEGIDLPENQISLDVTQKVKKGQTYFSSTNLLGFLPELSAVTATPCITPKGEIYAYLFVYESTAASGSFLSGLRRFFILNALIVMAVAFLISYRFTAKTARPLRQIPQAADSFAKGDFSVRVPVGDEDDEISQLAISFNEMAGALARTEKTRSGFIANVSHDLRTPMTTIGGFIDGILDGTIPPERERHYLKIVSDEVKRLSRLVVVMMNVAKIEAGEVHLNLGTMDLFESTCTMLFTFEQRIEAKKIQIVLPEEESLKVTGDADLINQVIYNLIDNAVKFTPEGGSITFAFEHSAADNMGVLTVTNTGEGIAQEDVSHIFDRFYKSDRSRGLDKNGMGLGLYIVKSIIDAHRGSISVSSVQGETTTFRVSLPLVKENRKTNLFHGRTAQ